MSNQQLNDPTRNWYITAQNIRTSTTGSNLTLDASANINLFSGTGPTGSIYFNNNAWFDSSANLNFSFGEGTYENALQTSTSNSTLILTNNDLFKTFSFNPTSNKIIRLPLSSTCKIGSWININNFSSTSTITIQDSTGALVYTVLSESISGTIGGNGVKMLAVSSSAQTGGGFASNWICSQSGGQTSSTGTGGTGFTGPQGIPGLGGIITNNGQFYGSGGSPVVDNLSTLYWTGTQFANGIAIETDGTGLSRVKVSTTGTYYFDCRVQIRVNNTEGQYGWTTNFYKNGTTMLTNSSTTENQGTSGATLTESTRVFIASVLVELNTNDYIQIKCNGIDSNSSYDNYTNTPACLLKVFQLAYNGPTGFTGPTGRQNLAQTLDIGNNAGLTGIDMNQQPITNVPNITSTTNLTITPGTSCGVIINQTGLGGPTGPALKIINSDPGLTGPTIVQYHNTTSPTGGDAASNYVTNANVIVNPGGTLAERMYSNIKTVLTNGSTGPTGPSASISFDLANSSATGVTGGMATIMTISGRDPTPYPAWSSSSLSDAQGVQIVTTDNTASLSRRDIAGLRVQNINNNGNAAVIQTVKQRNAIVSSSFSQNGDIIGAWSSWSTTAGGSYREYTRIRTQISNATSLANIGTDGAVVIAVSENDNTGQKPLKDMLRCDGGYPLTLPGGPTGPYNLSYSTMVFNPTGASGPQDITGIKAIGNASFNYGETGQFLISNGPNSSFTWGGATGITGPTGAPGVVSVAPGLAGPVGGFLLTRTGPATAATNEGNVWNVSNFFGVVSAFPLGVPIRTFSDTNGFPVVNITVDIPINFGRMGTIVAFALDPSTITPGVNEPWVQTTPRSYTAASAIGGAQSNNGWNSGISPSTNSHTFFGVSNINEFSTGLISTLNYSSSGLTTGMSVWIYLY